MSNEEKTIGEFDYKGHKVQITNHYLVCPQGKFRKVIEKGVSLQDNGGIPKDEIVEDELIEYVTPVKKENIIGTFVHNGQEFEVTNKFVIVNNEKYRPVKEHKKWMPFTQRLKHEVSLIATEINDNILSG